MRFPFAVLVCVLFLSAPLFSQTVAEAKPDEAAEALQKNAVAFLRETMMDVSNMRTLENRISFTSELAALMWYHDAREARQMFGSAVTDFKALLQQYDSQMNALGAVEEESMSFSPFAMGDPTDAVRISRKMQIAMGVRQQIAMSIAEHEPELAYNFFFDSAGMITNPQFRKQLESTDRNFELLLIAQIASTNAEKAVDLAKRSLERGITSQHVELLKQIYNKDQSKAVEFGARLLSKAKETKPSEMDVWIIQSLLSFGSDVMDESRKSTDKAQIFSQGELRELGEMLGQALLASVDEASETNLALLDKFAPSRAVQIRNKTAASNRNGARDADMVRGDGNVGLSAAPPPPPAPRGRGQGNGPGVGSAGHAQSENELAEEKLMQDVQTLATKQIPKEERDRIVEQARKILNETPGREKKIAGLSLLAAQVRKAGDQALASEIMRDAAGLVRSQPKTYRDFLLLWMLATGYIDVEPDKAFSSLEEAIYRANELISSVVRIGEFIDVTEEMIVDGEVQVGSFGGGMLRGLTREIGIAESTVGKLVRTDFDKTRALTNRFDRTEIRVLAKMLVLRSVLGKKQPTKQAELSIDDF